MKKKRRWLYRVIAGLLPLVLLALVELALRVFQYGYDSSLFIAAPGNKDYLVFNPDAAKRYFTDPLNAPIGNREPFRKVKEAGTLRIFVLGESTTIGYPYFHNGSFHRWLQYRLMRTFPGRKVEIINLSLTAVNSYTVLGFAREVARYEPDAVLIYTGHNEYYGALGVGSTDRLGGNPWLVHTLLWLRKLRVVQLVTRVMDGVGRLFSPARSGKTRMELMVGDQQIIYGSPLFDRGIRQFEENMEETLDIFHRQHIPVFISNLVCNLKDQRPFISIPGQDTASALYDYQSAGKSWASGDFSGAKQDFILAKEMDALRFRAPERINDIIGGLCRKYDNVYLVDTRSAFEAVSEHGVIGKSLMLEHVHPNLTGYALMSDAFYRAMQEHGVIPVSGERTMSLPQLIAEMPLTSVDSLTGAYRITNLESNWPFSDSIHPAGPPGRDVLHLSTEEEDLAYAVAFEHLPWDGAMRQLYDFYSKTEDWPRAARVMEALCLEYPGDAGWYEKTGQLYGKLQENEKAILYFDQAFRYEPGFEKARYLFVLCLEEDRPGDAIPYLDYAIANNPAGTNLEALRSDVQEVIRLERQLARNPGDTGIMRSIAGIYSGMGNKAGAMKYSK
jgi:lysophospholipase L1-like esterase